MNMLNDKVSIPAMSMAYASNKALKVNLKILTYKYMHQEFFCEYKCSKSYRSRSDLSIYQSIYLSIYLRIYQSIYLFIYLSL